MKHTNVNSCINANVESTLVFKINKETNSVWLFLRLTFCVFSATYTVNYRLEFATTLLLVGILIYLFKSVSLS